MPDIALTFVRRLSHDDPDALRETRELLARLQRPWRAAPGLSTFARHEELCGAVDAEIEAIKGRLPAPLPCARGCNHCCQFNEIWVSALEAALIVRYLEALPAAARDVIVARIRAQRGASGGGVDSPCALLEREGCSIYPARPLPCRGYSSLSEAACRARLHDGGPDPSTLVATRIVEFAAMDIAEAGRRPPYEINALLHRIYSDPDKPRRWATGDFSDEPDLERRSAK